MPDPFLSDETALLIVSCAAAIHQDLYCLVDLLNEQARILKRLVASRGRLSNDDRRRLAVLAQKLDRKVLERHELLVTVDTFRRWFRRLIAATYTSHRRGRPRLNPETERLIVRMATDNPGWGEDAIRDRLAHLDIHVSDRTVSNVLRRNGVPPAPQRTPTNDWKRFLDAHWPHLAALDFATFEIPDVRGKTQRVHALYAMKPATKEVRLAGISDRANGEWMLNCARALTDPDTGFLKDSTAVIMDRDPLFIHPAKACFASIGCRPKVLPPHSPNLNAFIERFIGTVRREIGHHIIPLSLDHLEHVLREHLAYYNHERTHQGLPGHSIPIPTHDRVSNQRAPICCRSRLGKTLNFYHREAA